MKHIEAIIFLLVNGVVFYLLVYGLIVAKFQKVTPFEKLEVDYRALGKKYKHLFGQNRVLWDTTVYLQEALERAEARIKEDQLVREKLEGEVARLERELRSREFELHEERSRKKGRRK
jgi:hypothetical protein